VGRFLLETTSPNGHCLASVTAHGLSSVNGAIHAPEREDPAVSSRYLSQIGGLYGQIPYHDAIPSPFESVANRALLVVFDLSSLDDFLVLPQYGSRCGEEKV